MTQKTLQNARKFEKICAILDRFDRNPAKLIPILQAVQEEYRYLSEEIMTFLATSLNLPPSKVYGVATFFSHFALKPKGKHVIRICDGTACHVKKSIPVLEALRERLGLKDKEITTADMLFTIETVSCLGACGLAPVIVVDDAVHGQMTPDKAIKVINDIILEEEKANA